MKQPIYSFVRVSFLLALVFPVWAEADLEPAAQDPVTFVTSTVKPWGFQNEAGQLDGLLVHFAEALTREVNLPMRNQLQPYPRVIHSVSNGTADMAVLFDSPMASDIGLCLGQVTDTEILLVVKQGAPQVASLADLSGWRVGYIRGSKYTPAFDQADNFVRIPINTMQQGLAMLLSGRLDAMTSADQTLFYAMDKMGIAPEQIQRLLVLGTTTASLYMSKRSTKQHLIPYYRAALERLTSSGQLAQIFYRQGLGSVAGSP